MSLQPAIEPTMLSCRICKQKLEVENLKGYFYTLGCSNSKCVNYLKPRQQSEIDELVFYSDLMKLSPAEQEIALEQYTKAVLKTTDTLQTAAPSAP